MNLVIGILSAAVLPIVNKRNGNTRRWLSGVQMLWSGVILLYCLTALPKIWDGSGRIFTPICMLLLGIWGIFRGEKTAESVGAVMMMLVLPLFLGIGAVAAEDVNWGWAFNNGMDFHPSVVTACLIPSIMHKLPAEGTAKKWFWTIPITAVLFSLVIRGMVPSLASDIVGITEMGRSVELFGRVVRLEALVAMALTLSLYALVSMLLACANTAADVIIPKWKKWAAPAEAVLVTVGLLCKITISDEIAAIGSVICWVILPLITQLVDAGKK